MRRHARKIRLAVLSALVVWVGYLNMTAGRQGDGAAEVAPRQAVGQRAALPDGVGGVPASGRAPANEVPASAAASNYGTTPYFSMNTANSLSNSPLLDPDGTMSSRMERVCGFDAAQSGALNAELAALTKKVKDWELATAAVVPDGMGGEWMEIVPDPALREEVRRALEGCLAGLFPKAMVSGMAKLLLHEEHVVSLHYRTNIAWLDGGPGGEVTLSKRYANAQRIACLGTNGDLVAARARWGHLLK